MKNHLQFFIKVIFFLFPFSFLLSPFSSAQPQKMSYQAVIRNASSALVVSHSVGMKISILQGSSSGSAVYAETQTPTTNANGLATIEIGGGTVVTGTFAGIDWSTGTYYIKTETDPAGGADYTITGTSQLLSVPYALYAKTVLGTSGTNSGDETTATIKSKLGIATLSGSNTGDQDIAAMTHTNRTALDAVSGTNNGDQTLPTLISLGAVAGNSAITGATNTKITYDAKGLVTAGAAATTTDIASSSDKRYVTDAQLTVIGNTSNTNSGDNAVNSSYSGLVTNATHTGDATGSGALTLATVNSNVGSYNNVTINAKGLVTAGSNVSYLTTETDGSVKTINGIVKSNGTTISAATAGTDYLTPSGSAASLTNFPTLNQSTTGAAASFTGSMVGDVTGTQGATVVSTVGGVTAANVASGANLANAATNANTASTIVKRDASGNFTAGTISAALNGNAATSTTAATVTTAAQPVITSVGTLASLTVSGTTTVITPVNATDAANKSYVDALMDKIQQLQAEVGVKDVEGNLYKAVKIGNQVWMSENLKTTKYNDGTTIPNVTDNTAWAALPTGAYSWYNNDATTYKATYGALYNWYAVDNNPSTKAASNGGKNVCPTGWHVPSDAEWTTLTTFLGGEAVAGGKLKETGTTHWTAPNTGATNETGFTALPGGSRGGYGTYGSIGNYGNWWSSTESSATYAWGRYMGYDDAGVGRGGGSKQYGFSVRCVRDF